MEAGSYTRGYFFVLASPSPSQLVHVSGHVRVRKGEGKEGLGCGKLTELVLPDEVFESTACATPAVKHAAPEGEGISLSR